MQNHDYDLYIIGPITIDYDEFQGRVQPILGGPVVFSAYAAQGSGYHVGLLAKLAEADRYVEQLIYLRDMEILPTEKSTSVRVIYPGNDRNTRELLVLSLIDPFRPADIPEVSAACYQIVGNINGQIDYALFPMLAQRGKIACDMQGFVREVQPDRTVEAKDWQEKRQYLPYIDYLKVDADEAFTMTGERDRIKAAEILYGWGAKEVLLTHQDEVLVYDGRPHVVPFRPENTSGRSGRGDTTIGCYAAERTRHGVDAALLYTAALVSMKLGKFGPFRGNRDDVLRFAETRYPEYLNEDIRRELSCGLRSLPAGDDRQEEKGK